MQWSNSIGFLIEIALRPSVFPQRVVKTTPMTEAADRLGSVGLDILLWNSARWILTSFMTLPSPVFAVVTQNGSVSG